MKRLAAYAFFSLLLAWLVWRVPDLLASATFWTDYASSGPASGSLFPGEDLWLVSLAYLGRTLVVMLAAYLLAFAGGLWLALEDMLEGLQAPRRLPTLMHSIPPYVWAFVMYAALGFLPPWLGAFITALVIFFPSHYLALRGALLGADAPRHMLYAQAYGIWGLRLRLRGLMPAIGSVFAVLGGRLPHAIAGMPFVEIAWRYPGVGSLMLRAIVSGDTMLMKVLVSVIVALSLVVVILSRLPALVISHAVYDEAY